MEWGENSVRRSFSERIIQVITNPTAQDIVAHCIVGHEQCHVGPPDLPTKPTCKCGETVREPNLPDAPERASECACYMTEQVCLRLKIRECGSDAECSEQVQRRINFVKYARSYYGCMSLIDDWLPAPNPNVK